MNLLMNYSADILATLGSLGAMAYCMILSRRLSRLTSFDKGLGGAIAVMSSQVDEMKTALSEAKAGSDGAGNQLHDLVHQARDISTELEMMIAACHDFAEEAISVQVPPVDPDTPVEEEAEGVPAQADEAPAEQDVPAQEEAAEDSSVTPMFGSRRATAEKTNVEMSTEATVEPLFRRRRAAS